MKRAVLFIGSILALTTGISAQTIDPRIEGASKFLVDRANENMLYIFEERLQENGLLQVYFPYTFSAVRRANLKVILTDSTLWKKNIERDLGDLSLKIANRITQGLNDELEADVIGRFLNEAGNTYIIYNGQKYPITSLPVPRDMELEKLINPIYNNPLYRIKDQLSEAVSMTIAIDYLSGDIPASTLTESHDSLIIQLNNSINLFYQWQANVKKLDLEPNKNEFVNVVNTTIHTLTLYRDLLEYVSVIADHDYSYGYKISFAVSLIGSISETYGTEWLNLPDADLYKKYLHSFKAYAVFFAQLADAQTADQTEAILKAATVPPVSFAAKRQSGYRRISVSSYLGFSGGAEIRGNNGLAVGGFFTPIGLELSNGTSKERSLAIMASFLDFGNVVNRQIYDTDATIKLSDLFTPGFMINYGFRKLPLALNVSYNYTNALRHDNSSAHLVRIGLSFDMPLFIFY